MDQIGPSTSDFATFRKVNLDACDEMVELIMEAGELEERAARDLIMKTGTLMLSSVRDRVNEAHPDRAVRDLLMEALLIGYGWSALATHYDLDGDYIRTLDLLNSLKVQNDNDLPPAEEKG